MERKKENGKGRREGEARGRRSRRSVCLICPVMSHRELTSWQERKRATEREREARQRTVEGYGGDSEEEERREGAWLASTVGVNYIGYRRCQQPHYQISIESRSLVPITSASRVGEERRGAPTPCAIASTPSWLVPRYWLSCFSLSLT